MGRWFWTRRVQGSRALLPWTAIGVLVLTILAATAQSRAEEPVSPVTPPQLRDFVAAEYPPAALAARIEASVVMRLTIDELGNVIAAELQEPAGNGFDEAALAVVKQFHFEPARRGVTPIRARILYRYTFRLPAAQPPPADARAVPQGRAPEPDETSPRPPASGVPPPEVAAAAGKPRASAATEVTVRGAAAAKRLQQSAEAVTVVETTRARQQTRDLGQVLAGVEGVVVRTSAGLGSPTRFSLNGLYDEQIRFFLDGVPLDIAGYPFGIASVPVNLIDRVEIYRGVLPVRYGVDALGGAVNLVTDTKYRTGGGASYQIGSFHVHRATAFARFKDDATGFIAGVTGYVDRARNDYEITVPIADETGRSTPRRVRRRHDAFEGEGVNAEVGVVERPWAKRLSAELYASDSSKELQHDLTMSRPFGEASFGAGNLGATLRYDVALLPGLELSALANAARHTIRFHDVSNVVYNWYGLPNGQSLTGGEVAHTPFDLTIWQDGGFGRLGLTWRPRDEDALRVFSTARFYRRTGLNKALDKASQEIDPLEQPSTMLTVVTGLEYELNRFDMRAHPAASDFDPSRDDRLQNSLFAKHYELAASSTGRFDHGLHPPVDIQRTLFGAGDAARFRVAKWLYTKASYEYTTRLPSINELFGDGVLVQPNPDLKPERSHNVNLAGYLDLRSPSLGALAVSGEGFWRETSQLIVLTADTALSKYANVFDARTLGVEAAASWSTPSRWLILDGNMTLQDIRSTSGDYAGVRIPNRPWLLGNWAARCVWRNVLTYDDEVSPFYFGHYIHETYLTWENIARRDTKPLIPSQLTHSIGFTYVVRRSHEWMFTSEVDNLTDAQTFDFYGVQRPGRSFALKVSAEL